LILPAFNKQPNDKAELPGGFAVATSLRAPQQRPN